MIEINGRRIGPGQPTYIVAELSANHGGDYDRAARIIEAAKSAGADAVKVQTYTADTLTIDCADDRFLIKGTLWNNRKLYDLYEEAAMPWKWQPKLQQLAGNLGMDFFSTPFDETAVVFLEDLGVPVYKVASFEAVDLPLLRRIAETGKPIIVSTGMLTEAEIDEAVQTVQKCGCNQIILLKCTSAYPAPPHGMNLKSIPYIADTFDLDVGLSDHTLGTAVPVAAVALGACLIEKHLTDSRSHSGPDSAFSLEPDEFSEMVGAVRVAEQALGKVYLGVSGEEQSSVAFRRSLFVVEDIRQGDSFTSDNVRSIRPGHGLHTRYLESILGRKALRTISRGTPLEWNLIERDAPS